MQPVGSEECIYHRNMGSVKPVGSEECIYLRNVGSVQPVGSEKWVRCSKWAKRNALMAFSGEISAPPPFQTTKTSKFCGHIVFQSQCSFL